MEVVKCPTCGHHELFDDMFSWLPDENGYPTVENMVCSNCLTACHQIDDNPVADFEHFKIVDEIPEEDRERLEKIYFERQINTPSVSSDGLPF